ncbi:hypothetical protein [Candidatus Pelagisphaera phototrophica]|uniref:hypothetical protein n=1 Tax=Candidatus Pelagisphaera phototrophica TaxID=2684113 RepID=UPI0019E8AA89|nr:hypothetical protein [Candidatus Pelagisphaera phototrophica]QXD31022.1 hypothetical protein GA004_11795 [Candidatus Pelagisphaera phototrophica]
MISWLQTNFQKHFRVLFIVLLGVIIVAFVFTIGAAPGIGDGRNQDRNIQFFGNEFSTDSQRQEFFNAAYYSALLTGAPLNQDQLTQYAFNRAAALHLADLHNIPGPNSEQLTEHIQQLGMFQGPDQTFSREAYVRFRDEIRASGNISEGALSLIIADDYRVNKVFDGLSSPGFVLESEVIQDLVLDQTVWSVNVAEYDFANFSPEIDYSEEKLEAFYVQNSFRYASPTRRTISFVEFEALDHIAEVEVTEESLQDYFARNSYKYKKTVEAPPSEDPEAEPAAPITEPATFEESRDQVEFDFKLEEAKKIGQTKAENLALALVEADNAVGTTDSLSIDRIESLIEKRGYQTKRTTPFARNETPIGLNWSQNLIALSFQLTENHIYSQPVIEGDSTFVLYLESENEEFVPNFKTVEPRVRENYAEDEARRLGSSKGQELADALKAVDADSFKAEAEARGLKVSEYNEFKRRDTVEGLDAGLIFSASELEKDGVSDVTIREDKAYIVQVTKKEIPEITRDDEEYTTRMEVLKSNYAQYSVSQYISKLTNDELVRSGLATAN